MKNASLQPVSPSSSIHLVYSQGRQASLPEGVPADVSAPLPPEMQQAGIMGAAGSLNEVDPSSEWRERKPVAVVNPATVLLELFELLEDYSPVWYTDDNHHRAVAALRSAIR